MPAHKRCETHKLHKLLLEVIKFLYIALSLEFIKFLYVGLLLEFLKFLCILVFALFAPSFPATETQVNAVNCTDGFGKQKAASFRSVLTCIGRTRLYSSCVFDAS